MKDAGETLDSGVCYQAFFADPDGNALAIHHRYAPEDQTPGKSVRPGFERSGTSRFARDTAVRAAFRIG